jgi:hypothetical protein
VRSDPPFFIPRALRLFIRRRSLLVVPLVTASIRAGTIRRRVLARELLDASHWGTQHLRGRIDARRRQPFSAPNTTTGFQESAATFFRKEPFLCAVLCLSD